MSKSSAKKKLALDRTDEEFAAVLREGAARRRAMLEYFGIVPQSILRLHRGGLSRQMFIYQQEVPERNASKNDEVQAKTRKMVSAGARVSTNASGRRVGRGHLGASIMPAELVEFFIKYYTRRGDTYLDPFMGQGIRMQVAKIYGLHYWGFDVSEEFFAYDRVVKDKIDDGSTTINIYKADARDPGVIPDGIGDFCFTSPPYWKLEYYGDEPEQLGNNTYEGFLADMQQVAAAWRPKFKPDAWVVMNVNDFRLGGKFYPYHADTIKLFQAAGYEFADIWVLDSIINSLNRVFAVGSNLNRQAPRIHEYAVVFRP